MCAMPPQQQKALKINLGAVKRLTKEVASYKDEVKELQDKIDKSEYEQGSPEMKRLKLMREESDAVVHDVERKLNDFRGKLAKALKDVGDQFPDDPMVIEAKQILGQ